MVGHSGGVRQREPMSARLPPEPSTTILVMGGRISRANIERLCVRVRDLLEESGEELVVCDVGSLLDPDAVTVDALARMQLTARRLGRSIQIRHPCPELRDLLGLVGLTDIVQISETSRPGGQTEEREQSGSVQEEVHGGNSSA
jgi:ABC-type transporter Mla MlaB component